ncbi:MAG: putative ATP-dependent RNA helicase [Methanosaeta sp. PtaU1.Bin060]|nr:MAG: putative ATP-dependent RNA helicase [Methanosaeta sp. PtaU1.Bin060]
MDAKVGDIVELRSRLWRVDSLEGDALAATNIEGGEIEQRHFFLPFETVRKANIEPPNPGILGDPASNKLLIQSYRYSMLHGAAPLLSLQRSSVIPTSYQLVPVVMALEKSNRVRMMIADDVGLGKTIEAGLIVAELMARNLASRILVVCPRNLREQWREALEYFFHIDARVISSMHRRVLERQLPPGASPWEHYRCLVASIDYVKKDPIKHQVLAIPWDLVIVDEAHLAAKPHQSGENQSVSMDRYDFVRELSARAKHLLFLTATPHNGYTDSYASLLRMLDGNLVSGPINEPKINRDLAREHICQRRRKDVEDWFKEHSEEENPFPERKQEEVLVDLIFDEEKQILRTLSSYGTKILDSAEGGSYKTQITAKWTVMHLHKRGISSPAALRQSLKNRKNKLLSKIKSAESEDQASLPFEQAKATVLDEDLGDDETDEEAYYKADRNVFGSLEANKAELAELEKLLPLAEKITPAKDSKLRKLTRDFLSQAISGYYGPAKIIIFTRYKDTLDYLEREIPRRLPESKSDIKIITVYGELNEAQRKERLNEFQRLEKGILIATDCISEGINLQHMANIMVHYELPWNPNRLEQRNGRIDRYGQKVPQVHIRTMVMSDTLDATILKVLVEKARRIREEFGFSPPFFGDDANVIDIIREQGIDVPSAQKKLIDFGEDSRSQEQINPFDEETIERIKSESFYGQSDVDFSEVRNRMKETEELIGSEEDFRNLVLNAFRKLGCTIEENHDFENTLHINFKNSQLTIPGHEDEIKRATFDPKLALQNKDIVQLNAGRPMVRKAIELVRQSVFEGKTANYGRTAAIATAAVQKVILLYHFLARFTVNTKPAGIIEEILPVACDLTGSDPLDSKEIEAIWRSRPEPMRRTREEILPHLKKAVDPAIYTPILQQRLDKRLEAIKQERAELKKKFDESDQLWLEGIDDVSQASTDLLSVTIYYPVTPRGANR